MIGSTGAFGTFTILFLGPSIGFGLPTTFAIGLSTLILSICCCNPGLLILLSFANTCNICDIIFCFIKFSSISAPPLDPPFLSPLYNTLFVFSLINLSNSFASSFCFFSNFCTFNIFSPLFFSFIFFCIISFFSLLDKFFKIFLTLEYFFFLIRKASSDIALLN